MKTGFLTLLMVLAMTFTGCQAQTYKVVPSKNYVTQRVNLGNVSSLTTYSFVDIIYKPSSCPAYAEVYAPDNIAKYVKLEEKGGELKVIFKVPGTNSYSINGKYTCEVRVYAPSVTSFCTLSSGDIKIDGDLNTRKDISLQTNSSGDIDARDLRCATLNIQTNSSGDIEAGNVECSKLVMCTNSSGDVSLEKANCDKAFLSTNSSGDCKVSTLVCQNNVDATANSSGDIFVSGSCRQAAFSANSSGDINASGLKAAKVSAVSNSSGDITCHASQSVSAYCYSSGNIGYSGNPSKVETSKKGVYRM